MRTERQLGARVEARWKGKSRWFKGRIDGRDGANFAVAYDDGDHEKRVPAKFIRRIDEEEEVEAEEEVEEEEEEAIAAPAPAPAAATRTTAALEDE